MMLLHRSSFVCIKGLELAATGSKITLIIKKSFSSSSSPRSHGKLLQPLGPLTWRSQFTPSPNTRRNSSSIAKMSDKKVISVFGATGNQGGSVLKALLNDAEISKNFRLRGVTRDTSKKSSQVLADQGVEMVVADMNSKDTAAPAVKGAHTVFFVTNFWESRDADVELAQGQHITDAAKEAGVQHIVFSSLPSVTDISGGRLTHVTHFDSKSKIEKYIVNSGIAATFVQPGYFMSNLNTAIKKQEDGSYTFTVPVNADKAQLPLCDIGNDYGKFVKAGIKHFPSTNGKVIHAACKYYTPNEILKTFSQVIGKPASVVEVSQDAFKARMSPDVAQEMLENMLLLEDPGYYGGADLSESVGLLEEKPRSWEEYVQANKGVWA